MYIEPKELPNEENTTTAETIKLVLFWSISNSIRELITG